MDVMLWLKVVEIKAGVATHMTLVINNMVAKLSVGFIYVSEILFSTVWSIVVVLGGNCQKCNLDVMACIVRQNPGVSSCCSAKNCGQSRP
jgi:hypothetical protein